MKTKNIFKVARILLTSSIAVAISIRFKQKAMQKKIATQNKLSDEAFREFLVLNDLYEGREINYVGSFGYTPVYAYKAKNFKIKKAFVPKGYVMHKITHFNGAFHYAYSKEVTGDSLFSDYHILFHLMDEKTWFKDEF